MLMPNRKSRRKLLGMNIWLTIRTFIALFLVVFGIGVMFNSWTSRLATGALFAAFGLTFLVRVALVLRER
jgi:hypothetical protein